MKSISKKLRLKFTPLLAVAAVTLVVVSSGAGTFAQDGDIVLLNQDGEEVAKGRLAEQPGVENVDKPNPVRKQVTGVDENGKPRQVDLTNARSVVIQSSVQTVNNNGEQETKQMRKAIVVDADGNRIEVDLSGDKGDDFPMPMMGNLMPQIAKSKRAANKYMIGVHCTPVPASLQAHLSLEEGTGLLVNSVGDNSPATRQLQRHDILLFADDQELRTNEDLVSVVQKAGNESNKLSLTVMRSGQEIGVELKPVERPKGQLALRRRFFQHGGLGELEFGNMDEMFNELRLQNFGPGMIVDVETNFDEALEEMNQKMEEVQQRMQQMQQRMKQQLEKSE